MQDEWTDLPTVEKIEHKSWKARVCGYEECKKLFDGGEQNAEIGKIAPLIRNFPVDNNEAAREKALDALLSFTQNIPSAKRYVTDFVPGIIAKCLGGRVKTRDLAAEILCTCVEIEAQDTVVDELLKGCENKQPKVVQASLLILRSCLRDFGPKVIPLNTVLHRAIASIEHRDPIVRDEAKSALVDCYRWVGSSLESQLTSLKQVVRSELQEECKSITSLTTVPARYLRSQKPKAVEPSTKPDETPTEPENVNEPAVCEDQSFELAEEFDLLGNVPADFYEKIVEKKWQERRDALQALLPLTEKPRFAHGNYSELIGTLTKVVQSDTNVPLVAIAAKCLAGIARGLKKQYDPSIYKSTIETCLVRSKEKNASALESLKDAANATYDCFRDLESLADIVIPLLNHKIPQVRQHTTEFITRSFSSMPAAKTSKKLVKVFVPALIANGSAADGGVRDSAFHALAILLKAQESLVKPMLAELDSVKMDKVNHFLSADGPAGQKAATGGKTTSSEAEVVQRKEATAPTTSGKGLKKATSGKAAKPSGKSASDKKQAEQPQANVVPPETEMNPETAEEMLMEVSGEETLKKMLDSNWKERLEAMTKFLQDVRNASVSQAPPQAVVRVVLRKPGLKDPNYQTLKARIDILDYITSNNDPSPLCMRLCIPDLVEKLSDPKNGTIVKNTLLNFCDWCGFAETGEKVLCHCVQSKSPKVTAIGLEWFANALNDFGGRTLNVKNILTFLKSAVSSPNANVRSAAVSAAGVLFLHFGNVVASFFAEERASQALLAEFDKYKGKSAPAPTRGVSQPKQSCAENELAGEAPDGLRDTGTSATPQQRTNIASLLTPSLLEKLSDKSWKVRIEGLEELIQLVKQHPQISPNLGDLMNIMKQRLADSNKLVATAALSALAQLVRSLGPSAKSYVGLLLPSLYQLLADHKVTIRQGAVAVLDAMVDAVGLSPLIEGDTLIKALTSKNPSLKSDLCEWLAEACGRQSKVSVSDLKAIVPAVLACLEDRSQDVRNKAMSCIHPLMKILGYHTLVNIANVAKIADRPAVSAILEKASQHVVHDMLVDAGTSEAVEPVQAEESVRRRAPSSSSGSFHSTSRSHKSLSTGNSVDIRDSTNSGVPPDVLMIASNKAVRQAEFKVVGVKGMKVPNDATGQEAGAILHRQVEPVFSQNLVNLMFTDDFKQHICAISLLQKAAETEFDAMVSNIDLVFKWLSLRLAEHNTSVTARVLEFLNLVISSYKRRSLLLSDLDAHNILPALVAKMGDNKDSVRKATRTTLRQICHVFRPSGVVNCLIDSLKSRNARLRSACIEEIHMIAAYFAVELSVPTEKEIAKYISDRDPSVRSAALGVLAYVQATAQPDGDIFRRIGQLPEKERCMLEERIRRVQKSGAALPASDEAVAGNEAAPAAAKSANNAFNLSAAEFRRGYATKADNFGAASLSQESRVRRDIRTWMEQVEPQDRQCLPDPEGDFSKFVELIGYKPPPLPRRSSNIVPISILKNSQDCRQAICLVIAGIADSDPDRSIVSIAQIHEVVCDVTSREMMEPHIDYLLRTCCIKLRLCLQKENLLADTGGVIRLLRSMLCLLIALLALPELAFNISTGIVQDLLSSLLSICLYGQLLSSVDDDELLTRSVNVAVLQVLTNVNATNAYCALVGLLTDCCRSEHTEAVKLELVMKCLWRLHRMDKISCDEFSCSSVCAELETFFLQLPPDRRNASSDNLPYVTAKSIVADMVKYRHDELVACLQSDTSSEVQKVFDHVNKTFKRHPQRASRLTVNESSTKHSEHRRSSKAGRGKPEKSREYAKISNLLSELRENPDDVTAINELYSLICADSALDIQSILGNESQQFQKLIEKKISLAESAHLLEKFKSTKCQSPFGKRYSARNRTPDESTTELAFFLQGAGFGNLSSSNPFKMSDDSEGETFDEDALDALIQSCQEDVDKTRRELFPEHKPHKPSYDEFKGIDYYLDELENFQHYLSSCRQQQELSQQSWPGSTNSTRSILTSQLCIPKASNKMPDEEDQKQDDRDHVELSGLPATPSSKKIEDRAITMARSAQIEALRKRLAEIRISAGIQ